MSLTASIHREPGKAQNRKRVSGQATAERFRYRIGREFPTGDGGESNDLIAVRSNVRRADMVSELILPGIALEEAVEVDVAAAKA
jgi:hypothetical protein